MSKVKIPKSVIDSMLREHKIWFDTKQEGDLGIKNKCCFSLHLDDIVQREYCCIGMNLEGAFLPECNIIRLDMSFCNFSKSILTDSDLTKNIFFGANFRDSKLENVDFYRSDLRGAIFENAKISMSCFDNCDLRSAKFTTEIIDIESFYNCKVSKRHLPWLALHPRFYDTYPSLTVFE